MTAPYLYDLGAAAEIDSLVAAWRGALLDDINTFGNRRRNEREVQRSGLQLRDLLWTDLSSHLTEATSLFIVPSGALLHLPFEALPGTRSVFLIEELPPLRYLTSERELLRDTPVESAGRGLLCMGGDVIDAHKDTSSSLGNAKGNLPGVGDEIRIVQEVWRGSRQYIDGQDLALTGTEAQEDRFKQAAPGKAIIHLAAHTFYADSETGKGAEELRRQLQGSGNPLARCGIALAGPGHTAMEADDGFLSAEEIGLMDLKDAELVVLSACSSGLGTIHGGQDLLGLRRAFRVAGARNVLVSLWPLRDYFCTHWSERFYRGLLELNSDPATAAREASLSMLEERRRRGLSISPVYWSGFICFTSGVQ